MADIVMTPVGLNNEVKQPSKPSYLIKFINKSEEFLTLDKPELINNLVVCKGFYVKKSDVAENNYPKLIVDNKANVREVMFPTNRIKSIINLVFRQK